jgi:hypothetical protein
MIKEMAGDFNRSGAHGIAGPLALAALGYSQRKRFAKKLSAEQVLKRA